MEHTVTYVCEKNRSLAAIAEDMNVSEDELRKLNPYASEGAGQLLRCLRAEDAQKGVFIKCEAGTRCPMSRRVLESA